MLVSDLLSVWNRIDHTIFVTLFAVLPLFSDPHPTHPSSASYGGAKAS